MLRIVLSNRYEVLEGALLSRLDEAPSSPFVADQVIVPSAAIRRRVELAIADRTGICANVEFPFLAQWLWKQIGRVIPVAEISPFAPDVLAWRVDTILRDETFVAAHPPLARYLAGGDARRRFDLATRAAAVIESYITYRPDWLRRWSDGKSVASLDASPVFVAHEPWQAALWRRIAAAVGTGRRHPAELFLRALDEGGLADTAALPARAQVFCVPAMPPLYLDLVRGLARFIDIDVYALDPSEEYWLDIVDPRRLAWLAARGDVEHRESGNRLLAAWGTQTRQYLDLLLAGDNSASTIEASAFVAAGGDSLLAQLQNGILALRDPAPRSVAVAADDRSVEVHVCHSRSREIEVLHDQLLALFALADAPRPSDILVVTPDIEAAAPLIDAVFGNAPKARYIPFAISGRPRARVNAAARALLALLALGASRYRASEIADLLQTPMVARRFGLDVAGLERVHRWLRDAGIRWGQDAAHRAAFDVPPEPRYTLDDGLERLLLGYALPADAAQPFDGRLPAGDAEGGDTPILGSFARFADMLRGLRAALAAPKGPVRWHETLREIVATFMAPDDDEIEDARELDTALATLRDRMQEGGADALPLAVVATALTAVLDDPAHGGVPSGFVTFTSMASLRGLPFDVVCAIGLDDAAFPSIVPPSEFDLMAAAPRRGDRQRRDADRNVFLDLMLAARRRFYVSYAGRGMRDNSPLPPATPVAELIDYVATALAAPPSDAHARIVVTHPMQPFGESAFVPGSDSRQRSFDADYCAARRSTLVARDAASAPPAGESDGTVPAADEGETDAEDARAAEPVAPFFFAPLASPEPTWRDIPLPRLLSFYRNPSRFLLTQRLAIALPWDDDPIADDEPFLADGRARRALAERLLDAFLAGRPREEVRELASAGLEYPPGRLGDLLRDRELAQIESFADSIARDSALPPLPPSTHEIALTGDAPPWRLRGDLADLRSNGLVRHRYRDTHASDYVSGWIEHLFVNVVRPPGVTPQLTWHSRNGTFRLAPLPSRDEAHAALADLGALYARGLQAPLKFFPRASWAYATKGAFAARTEWTNGMFPDRDDAATALALRGVPDVLDEDFQDNAHAILDPLLAQLDDPRVK